MMTVSQSEMHQFVLERISDAISRVDLVVKSHRILETIQMILGFEHLQRVGDFWQGEAVALFIDMRDSSRRARQQGPSLTYIVTQSFIPAMAHIVDRHGGVVGGLTGDGVYALFGLCNNNTPRSVEMAGISAVYMMKTMGEVINPLLEQKLHGKVHPLSCGIGIDVGHVMIVRTGSTYVSGVTAFGDCVNTAAKLSNGENTVRVSNRCIDIWPDAVSGTSVSVTSPAHDDRLDIDAGTVLWKRVEW